MPDKLSLAGQAARLSAMSSFVALASAVRSNLPGCRRCLGVGAAALRPGMRFSMAYSASLLAL